MPKRRGDADEPLDLLEREQACARQEVDRLRHAIDAADVAAVGDADPQVVVDPAEGVDQPQRIADSGGLGNDAGGRG